jgi:hypothetical protein
MRTMSKHAGITIETPSTSNDLLVSPPAEVQRFSAQPGEGPGTWIEYDKHPAYASFVASASFGTKIMACAGFAKYFVLILCKRLISYELIPAHLRQPRSLSGWWRFFQTCLANTINKLTGTTRLRGATSGEHVYAALSLDGICVAKMEAESIKRIQKAVQPLIEQLRHKRGLHVSGARDFTESRSTVLRTANEDVYAAVEDMLQRSGILDGCSAYIGHSAQLIDCNPQINDPSDNFWQCIFPDRVSELRPAAYFHRDASGGDIKAIIYLSDVGPSSGPFSYAIGSHSVRGSNLVDWIEETNDQSGYSSTQAKARRLFSALPAVLRRKCAFGNDLLPGTEITDRILQSEWVIEAPQGHIALFDTKGFHRGGMVTEGERIVLTCIIGSSHC